MAAAKTTKKESKSKKSHPDPVPANDLINIDETVYKTTLPEWFKRRKKWKPAEEGTVYSTIAGIVRKIDVEQGADVKKGDRIMILEAMKMYNEILSPVSGMVEAVLVEPNVNIPKGTLMIKIKPQQESHKE